MDFSLFSFPHQSFALPFSPGHFKRRRAGSLVGARICGYPSGCQFSMMWRGFWTVRENSQKDGKSHFNHIFVRKKQCFKPKNCLVGIFFLPLYFETSELELWSCGRELYQYNLFPIRIWLTATSTNQMYKTNTALHLKHTDNWILPVHLFQGFAFNLVFQKQLAQTLSREESLDKREKYIFVFCTNILDPSNWNCQPTPRKMTALVWH